MSIVSEIINEFLKTELSYKGARVNLFGIPIYNEYKKSSYASSISRLKGKGFIDEDKLGWFITSDGKKFCKNNKKYKNFNSPFSEKTPRDLLVIFDISQDRKKERDWLRWQLKKFNYSMIQRSVWVGPSPLPVEFKRYLEDIKLKECIKTFKLKSGYIFDK